VAGATLSGMAGRVILLLVRAFRRVKRCRVACFMNSASIHAAMRQSEPSSGFMTDVSSAERHSGQVYPHLTFEPRALCLRPTLRSGLEMGPVESRGGIGQADSEV
jgi:hypothetical protein